MRYRIALTMVALCACDDGGSDDAPGDAAARGDSGRQLADGPPADFAADVAVADAAPDARVSDGPAPDAAAGIGDCEAACARYGACERLDLFGDEAACVEACGRAARESAPAEWFACLEAVECEAIETCELPRPVGLACDVVCAAVEACDAGGLLPECAAVCPESAGPARCAEHLVDGVCALDDFRRCLGREVHPECGPVCAQAAECNIFEEAVCLEACFGIAREGDPLARRRAEQRAECVASSANDCFRVNQCVDPNAVFGRGNTCLGACEGLAQCGVVAADMLRDCLDQCEQSLAEDPEGHQFVIDCTVEFLVPGGCEPDGFASCLELEPPTRPAPCVALCEARRLCEREGGVDEVACLEACQNARVAGGGGLWGLQLPCGRETSCDTFGACLDRADPEAGCAAHCGRRDACMLEGGCPEACARDFGRDRARAERDCVVEAGEDCAAMAECEGPEPPPCGAYCARLGECNLGAQPPDPAGCAARCDDDHFADADAALSRVACVLGAPVCDPANPFQPEHAVAACVLDPSVGEPFSRACLAWCTAHLPCALDDGDVAACVRDCGDGLEGADALRFAAAAECLLLADDCVALAACIPGEVPVDCAAHCAAVEGCGIGAEGCVAACADAPDADIAGCVLDATTRRRGCAAVAACVGFEAPAPGAACAELCAARASCEEEVDAFRCGLGCTPAPEGVGIQAACAQVADCANLADCLELPGAPSEACVDACAGVEGCGADVGACGERCSGRDASGAAGADYVADAAACVEALADGCGADVAEACFELPDDCAVACALLSQCNPLGLVGTPQECVDLMCPDGQIVDLWALNLQCAHDVYGPGGCDEEAFLACLGGM